MRQLQTKPLNWPQARARDAGKWVDVSVPIYPGMVHFPDNPSIEIDKISDVNQRDLCTISQFFYEYFHGDNGAGLGASHQTGWTGLVARMIQIFGYLDAASFLAGGKKAAFELQKPEERIAA